MKTLVLLFRRFAPHTFYGRAFLIFILPFLCIISISTYVFYVRHWDKVTSTLASHVAQAFAYHTQSLTDGARSYSEIQSTTYRFFDVWITLKPADSMSSLQDDRYLIDALKHQGFQEFSIQKVQETFQIHVHVPQGVLEAKLPSSRLYLRTTDIFLMWYLGSHILFMGIAWVFMNNQIRPLKDLARLAEALGQGQPYQGIRIRGAQEVRQVGLAFIGMRQRIDRFVSERLELLAAISHDLKTPLTRMRLGLALIAHNDQASKLVHDVDDMQAMIQSYLDFVQTQKPERTQSLEIHAFLHSILARYPDHVVLTTSKRFKIPLQPLAFRRCIHNILDNALKFGQRAEIRYRTTPQGLWLTIDDDGPGISSEHQTMVFKPFYRADHARNQNIPGTGLGLTIVQDIVHHHGGKVRLGTSIWGGLRVMLFIPRIAHT